MWVLPLLLVAIVMARASWDAPLQRDASHFVFMAAHIAKGHAPYWALWDTKNPLVELWWAAWIAPLDGVLTWVHASRLAECAWMLATAVALQRWLLTAMRAQAIEERRALLHATLAAGAWLAWIMTPGVNDDGLTLSMYHALPELGVLAACLAISRVDVTTQRRRVLLLGVLLGACVFACWFVKQTSLLVAMGLIAGMVTLGVRRVRQIVLPLAVATGVVIGCGAIWAWHLVATGTWEAYVDGTITYKSRMAGAYPPDAFWHDTRAALPLGPWVRAPLTIITTTTLIGGLVALALLALPAWRRMRTREPLPEPALRSALTMLWLVFVLTQAVASLTYFRHYFLAALAPLVACVVLWLAACLWSRILAVGALSAALVVLLPSAWMEASRAHARGVTAPISITMGLVHERVPRDASLLNWSGLMHYFTLDDRTSRLPRNVWWPAIVAGVDESRRTSLMRAMLAPHPPEYALELFEEYPPEQALEPVRLSPALLRAWTDVDYVLVFETPQGQGRYAMAAKLYRRRDAAPPTIAPP